MAVIRTRFIFWLFKAYVKKWGKLFIIFFLVGLIIFFLLLRFSPVIIRYIPLEKKTTIGLTGAYTSDEIPNAIITRVSRGLTKVNENGEIAPDLASSWSIEDNGRKYIFRLKSNEKFTDGTRLTSKAIQYSFTDVSISRPDDYTIVFALKDEYAPFPVTVSKPIFRQGYIGLGDFIINNIELNGNFIKTIQLISRKNKLKTEEYIFYPTGESLKVAVMLGEVSEAQGLNDTAVDTVDLQSFPNLTVHKKPDFTKLITLFFNTADPLLSDKKLRTGLSYALPDEFQDGVRTFHPYPPSSEYLNATLSEKRNDTDHAKLLIGSARETASMSADITVEIKTLPKYRKTADAIKRSWKEIGIQSKIETVDTIPNTFQVYIGDFNVPKDPDQYTLWHSGQQNNISRLKNLRIDKLLEDGRRNTDPKKRLDIYYDFQKYLLDESPAAFLYFPYEYTISRK